MTAAAALSDHETLREIAYRARCDRRVVVAVLSGQGTPKGQRASGARSRVARVMAEMGIEPAVPGAALP